jgi:predicted transcriptional regulator
MILGVPSLIYEMGDEISDGNNGRLHNNSGPEYRLSLGRRYFGFEDSGLRRRTMKRSRQVIISQILEICINGASKTKIVYQANLNFRTINPYLELLIKNDLIRVNGERVILYETTPKGLRLLEDIKRIYNKLLGPI